MEARWPIGDREQDGRAYSDSHRSCGEPRRLRRLAPDGPFAKMTSKDVTSAIGGGSEPGPTEGDLAFARNAASDVLTKGDKDSSQPWTNPGPARAVR